MSQLFPPLPYADWSDTQATVHRFLQLVGKVRLAHGVRRNHWWNVPFHLTGRGITTRPMGLDPTFAIDFDFLDHHLRLDTIDGHTARLDLQNLSVADFATELSTILADAGIDPAVITTARPFDLPDAERRFLDDTEHHTYDPAAVTRYWQILSQVNQVLEQFAGRYSGKTSPVHHFWHTFDIAVTRFSDHVVDQPSTADPVTREAYSREVISFGFWFGDPSFGEPAFYSYTAPEPADLNLTSLPGNGEWLPRHGSHLAVLRYDDARAAPDPVGTVLEFLEASYQAGARRAGWDVDRYTCTGGVTDPLGSAG